MAKRVVAEINNLSLTFKDSLSGKATRVLDGASIKVNAGEVFAIIGESGSGKTVLSSLLNGFIGRGGKIESGSIKILDIDVTNFTPSDWNKSHIRGNIVGQVFQNPMSALTPNLKVGFQLVESLLDNKKYAKQSEAEAAVRKILTKVRISDHSRVWDKYPHELSGGLIQRVVLTMILAMQPQLVILDEPTTALDPIVQYEILDIVKDISHTSNIAFIFISHDIGVIANIADHIAVMYAGRVIEWGTKNEVLYNAQHPYTWGLLNSLPASAIGGVMTGIPGVFISDMIKPNVDAFAWRNQYALAIDFKERPPVFKVNDNHYAATWLLDERAPKVVKPPFIAKLGKYYAKKS